MFSHTIQRSAMGFVLGVAWFLLPNSAYAEAPHYQVELSVPASLPECNREADLIGMIEPMVTGPLLDPPYARVMTVRIAKSQGFYRLDLFVKEPDGRPIDEVHTELPASMSCFEVLYRGALRAALHMNLNATETQASGPPPPPPPPPPPSCPVCETPKQAPKPARIDRHWFVGAGGIVGFGLAPEIIGGGLLLGGWRWSPSWSMELNASTTIPQDTRPSGPTIVRIQTVLSASATPCFRVGAFGACGIIGWDRMAFERRGLIPYDIHTSDSVRVGLRGLMELRFADRWSARVNVDLALPILRSNISDETKEIFWHMPTVTGSIGGAVVTWF